MSAHTHKQLVCGAFGANRGIHEFNHILHLTEQLHSKALNANNINVLHFHIHCFPSLKWLQHTHLLNLRNTHFALNRQHPEKEAEMRGHQEVKKTFPEVKL